MRKRLVLFYVAAKSWIRR